MADVEIPESPKDNHERMIGLIIAVIAILLAVVSALGSKEDNSEIISQVETSNNWAHYQAKRQRMAMLENSNDMMRLQMESFSGQQKEHAQALINKN